MHNLWVAVSPCHHPACPLKYSMVTGIIWYKEYKLHLAGCISLPNTCAQKVPDPLQLAVVVFFFHQQVQILYLHSWLPLPIYTLCWLCPRIAQTHNMYMIIHCHLLCVVVMIYSTRGIVVAAHIYVMICDGIYMYKGMHVCVRACVHYYGHLLPWYCTTLTVSIIVHKLKKIAPCDS